MRGRLPLAVLVAALLGAAGCGARAVESAGLPVTASIFPLADFARRIGGDRVNVQTLIQGGGDAHDFQPAPRDLTQLARARLFVYNGGGFEPWAARVIRQLPPDAVAVDTTAGLGLRDDRGTDPHVWLDPLLAARQVDAIRGGLIRADPAGRTVYDANAAALAGELAALHDEFAAALGRCRRREFITAHAAFGHLARRYGLTMVPLSGLSPDAEPSPARLAAVVRLARQRGIAVVYT
ncbi:MAG: metal ABC transporter substrate-binding protein, partial [Candidatus Rokuibacteriota bacterium]